MKKAFSRKIQLKAVSNQKVEEDSFDQKFDGPSRRKKTKFFYKVTNHHELFRVGNSFFSDFQKGVKSFSISSTGYLTSQQKTILGLASFFDHQSDLKIAIVGENLDKGVFADIIEKSQDNQLVLDSETSITAHSFFHHFDFISLEALLRIEENYESEFEHEDILESFTQQYDVIFWDVPELYKIQERPDFYYPMILHFDCVTIIVPESKSTKQEIEKAKSFFSDYGINLKGLLIDPDKKIKK